MKRKPTRHPKSDPRVKALFNARYPFDEYQSNDSSKPDYLPSRQIDRTHAEMDAYESMLTALPSETLQLLYDQQQKALNKTERQRVDAAWNRYCFQDPDQRPQMGLWSAMERWTIEEAVALSIGVDPEHIDLRTARNRMEASEAARRFTQLYDLAERAKQAGSLEDPISPQKFAGWAKRHTTLLCPEFLGSVPFDQRTAQDLQAQVEKLSSKCREQAAGLKGSKQRMRTTQKLLLALAIRHYKFDPTQKYGPAISNIHTACSLVGHEMDRETIRGCLARASDEVRKPDELESGT